MSHRRQAGLCVFALAAYVLVGPGVGPAKAGNPAHCIGCDRVVQLPGNGETLGGGVERTGGGPDRSGDAGTAGRTPSRYSYTNREQVPACSANSPGNIDVLCTNAVSCPDATDTRSWIYEQTVTVDRARTPSVTRGPFRRLPGEFCLARDADAPPTVGEIAATVETEFVRKRPAEPDLQIQPRPKVLVTARNSFSAGSAAPVQLRDTALGLPVTITATPRRWVWDFGDGSSLTTTTPGSPGTLEVSHAYRKTGSFPVRVTVEWTGTFTVAGLAGNVPIDGVARVTSNPVLIQAREARSELVDS